MQDHHSITANTLKPKPKIWYIQWLYMSIFPIQSHDVHVFQFFRKRCFLRCFTYHFHWTRHSNAIKTILPYLICKMYTTLLCCHKDQWHLSCWTFNTDWCVLQLDHQGSQLIITKQYTDNVWDRLQVFWFLGFFFMLPESWNMSCQ